MKTTFAIISIFALFSCSSLSEKESENLINYKAAEVHLDAVSKEDTLKIPSNYYYMADLEIEKIASLILADSIQPADNFITFALLDSISSGSKSTRDAVFPAFKLVLEKSDGALSEAVGLYAMKYIEAYPKEFAERYSGYNTDLAKLTNYIGYELMMSEEPESEYKRLFENIRKRYPNAEHDKTLKIFEEELKDYMQKFKD